MTTREVVLDGGSPWGFRMHGGADVQQPLRISRVNPGSKAALKGIREGDLITSINGKSTREITNSEAHALLKNAGDTLKLGLNEDCSGSPKRRQYKTVHQETHSETIKRSSITSTTYTVSSSSTNIQSPSNTNNEKLGSFEKDDGDSDTKLNGVSTTPNKVISQRSTLSSNCSSVSSTPSTLPEFEGVCRGVELRKRNARYTATSNRRGPKLCGNNNNSVAVTSSTSDKAIMADNVIENSRTKRKRSRSGRKKSRRDSGGTKTVKITELTLSQIEEDNCDKIPESDDAIVAEADTKVEPTEENTQSVKITELSSNQVSEVMQETTNAIIAEEDFEWEVTDDGDEHPTIVISPEDENTLRNFLEGLNLVDSPSECLRQTYEKNTIDSIRSKKAKKRAALAQYFTPVYENPRFLEVISEEGSDLSDKEQKNTKEVVLVETKLFDTESTPEEDICNTSVIEGSSAEIVFLEDSSSSDCDEKCDSKNTTFDGDEQEKVDLVGVCEENHAIPPSQLTPPPTPDSVSPKNEFKESVGDLEATCEYSNAISPPSSRRSPSVSSNGSSSRGTSLCTVQYNPSGSSLTDIASIVKNGDIQNGVCTPLSLRELCLKSITSLPFGEDILQELAEVSLNIDKITDSLPGKILPTLRNELENNKSTLPVHLGKTLNSELETNKSIPVGVGVPQMPTRSDGKWVGIPVEENPHVLLCLSPTQREELDKKHKKIPDEAASLLDLHDKFLNRRGYFEHSGTEPEEFVENPKNLTNANNTLLAIIREATSPAKSSTLPNFTCGDSTLDSSNKDMYLYYVAKDDVERHHGKSEPFTRNTHRTLPRCELKSENFDDARLKARDLSQWLQLARFKSTSDSQLNTTGDTKRIKHSISVEIPEKTPTRRDPIEDVSFHLSNPWRRASLPQEIYKHQMQYILEKEREIQRELEKLEEEKQALASEMSNPHQREFEADKYRISRKGDIAIHTENDNTQKISPTKPRPKSMPMAPTEFFRQQMYEEYMKKVTAREERKQHKVIKMSSGITTKTNENIQNERSTFGDVTHVSGIEDEFMSKVKERMGKLGLHRDESDEIPPITNSDEENDPVLILDGDSLTGTKKLPKHLQEFIDITKEITGGDGTHGVWSPGQTQKNSVEEVIKKTEEKVKEKREEPPSPPVWTPKSAGSSPIVERKEFRPVNFESPKPARRNKQAKSEGPSTPDSSSAEPPWKVPETSSDVGVSLASSLEKRLTTSHSAPASGFGDFSTPRLPRAQNPTITLLQRAREGRLAKGANYVEQEEQPVRKPRNERPPIVEPGEIIYQIKNEYTSESENERPKKMADLGPRKFEGIGPTTKEGMPIILRSEVRDANQSKWYKRMYDTIHKQRNDDEFVTVRYKQRRARYPYSSGYLSEPEPGAYDSDNLSTDYKYATLDRRRLQPARDKENDYTSSTMPRSVTNKYTTSSDIIKHGQEVYKNQPGRIENYIPGHSSISEKEAKEWWDEVMDIFDGWLDDHSTLPSYNYVLSRAIARSHLEQQKYVPPQTRSYMSQALKESGYESDSTLIFRRRDDTAQKLSPQEQKEVYKSIQKGGDVPLHGLRKPAPERPKDGAEIEYIPISPTLTRIRVHKSIKPQKEIICYPVMTPPHPGNVFGKYKRTAPSSMTIPSTSKTQPAPAPPKRRSSRNNTTLRLISTMKLKNEKLPGCSRHETCFTTTSDVDKNKVKYLRDKITCKLSPSTKSKRGTDAKPRIKITKTVSTSPAFKSRVISTLTTSKDPKTSTNRITSKTNVCAKQEKSSPMTKKTKTSTNTNPRKPKDGSPPKRTFGSEKHKVDLTLPKLPEKRFKLVKSPDLVSPKEVKKAQLGQMVEAPKEPIYKKSSALFSSVKNGLKTQPKESALPIKVGITQKGREILGTPRSLPATPILSRGRNSSTSPSSDRSKISKSTTSLESLTRSPKTTKKETSKTVPGVIKKSKKDQLNGEIAKRDKRTKSANGKLKKCAGKAAGTEIVKKLKKITESDFCSTPTLNEIQKQKELVQTDSFYQHLFLRDLPSPTPSTTSKSSFITEKTVMLQKKRSSFSEPTIGAIKVYLNHTKPVTDSKFRSLDAAMVRSRSASPKSVRWHLEKPPKRDTSSGGDKERSSSLPPKLTFSETTRPVSPSSIYVRSPTPPSSRMTRSPSRRKIMHLRNLTQPIETYYGFKPKSDVPCHHYSTRSTSSIDSDYSEYQNYIKDALSPSRRSTRFKELNNFYAKLERMGELEKATSSTELRPRMKCEEEIIDYDRWKEVRTRERAEKELNKIYTQLKENQKEQDFLFRSKDIEAFRWKRECDRGLRVKEKSVEDIKEAFERLQKGEGECTRKELEYFRDTYKPLWRGSSVVNLASAMVEKRSLSEGREPVRPKPHYGERFGIGSHIWSSLSVEQVNNLKEQLSEIYNNNNNNNKIANGHHEYSIEVPPYKKSPRELTVRRNSDVSDEVHKFTPPKEDYKLKGVSGKSVTSPNTITEVEKKRLSQSLSREILEHASKRQKYKTSLSLVLGKETRGAIAAAEAHLKTTPSGPVSPRTCYSLEMSEDGTSCEKTPTNKDPDFVLVLTKEETPENQVKEKLQEWAQPKKALVTTDATSSTKISSTSETESGSTEDSVKTAVYLGNKDEVQKKVEYFEHAAESDTYTPTVYRPSESTYDIGETTTKECEDPPRKLSSSQSYQNLKELYGERNVMKYTTLPLTGSVTRNLVSNTLKKFEDTTSSSDSIYKSRSLSPYASDTEPLPVESGKVRKLKNKFEYLEDFYSHRISLKPKRWRSNPELNKRNFVFNGLPYVDVDSLRRKYEYPAIAGRGRSRIRRGGVVSPLFLRAEDRLMPHINIISKIASLYPRKGDSRDSLEKHRSNEEIAQILGCPVGEVQKLRERYESPDNISILGQMFTSSPNISELRDISPYLAASWIAHRYPKFEDNTRSLSSPEQFVSRDNSLVRRDRPKSASPIRPKKKPLSILKTQRYRPEGSFTDQNFDPTIHRPVCRYQPPAPRIEPVRYRSWWPPVPTHNRPSVTFKEPEGPVPPPKGHHVIKYPEPESPRKYVENEVTIHYRTPVRQEIKESLSEEELARRQAEAMKKIYQEERRRKYLQVSNSLQELQDMNSRRHTDNFIPSQKSPISLNRYDDFMDDLSPKIKPRPRSPEPRLVARALYNFVGQSARELTFRKGDIIYIRRQVDRNWYEGEHNAMIGLFPANYVEIVPYDGIKTTPRKPHEGQARAKYNFIAQTHLELSLAKGELVVITRRVDDNWFEGKIGGRKGIFPVSYVEVLIDPNDPPPTTVSSKPVAAPAAHSLLLNGSSGGKESMGSHSYTPNFSSPQLTTSYHAKPVQITGGGSYGSLSKSGKSPINQTLHVDTQSEPIPYRALYKYRPQNDDELELLEGDTVYVLEKCDDGWYVGSSERTGAFGTFPGNYVEQI